MKTLDIAELDQLASQVAHNDADLRYYNFHRKRYLLLLNTVFGISRKIQSPVILDIGASFQTYFLDHYIDKAAIDTMGFTLDRFKPIQNTTSDIPFDLTRSGEDEEVLNPIRGRYDIIILAEVIEHMYIRPERVLDTLSSLLKPGGYLILQTPNAAFLGSRIKLLLGKNPMPWIRDEPNNPGHYREYTKQELIKLSDMTGFELVSIIGRNYFSHPSAIKQTLLKVTALLPDTFKNGFTAVLKESKESKD